MAILKFGALAGAMVLASSLAYAADVPMEPVPMAPAPVYGGWYLRGDIGFSNQSVDDLDNPDYAGVTALQITGKDFDPAPFGGIGIGYKFNQWFRIDVTGEYRSEADFKGGDAFIVAPDDFSNSFTAKKSEWTGLLNAYVDLGTWSGFTPFVGGGIGFSQNTISDLVDRGSSVSLGTNSLAYAASDSQFNFAWALQAGLGYQISPNMTLEVAYRYLSLGDAKSGDIYAYNGACPPAGCTDNPEKFEDITSQDVKIGLRYMLGGN